MKIVKNKRKVILISRKEAEKIGLYKYYTGLPCKYGHISERYTDYANCCECESKFYKERYRRLKCVT